MTRKSLVDHFYDPQTTLAAVVAGQAAERGDFVAGTYDARLRRNPNRIQVITVIVSYDPDPKQVERRAWQARVKETLDYAALAALLK